MLPTQRSLLLRSWTLVRHAGQQRCLSGTAQGPEPNAAAVRSALEYCAQLNSTHDRDNNIWLAQLPKNVRARVLALRAFNLETLLVGEHVKSKEAPLVQIRFQWWREGVHAAVTGNPPEHPVLTALWWAHQQTPFSRYQLKRILDTREDDLLRSQPPFTMQELEHYAEGTASQLLYLQLAAAGITSREADHAASHVGKAVAIATVLRGTPYHASHRRSYLPLELCAKHKASQEDLYRGRPNEGLHEVVLEVATVARAHLQEAKSLAPKLPKGASQVLLPAVGAGMYLQALEKANFDVFDQRLQMGGGAMAPLWYTLLVKWHLMRGTY